VNAEPGASFCTRCGSAVRPGAFFCASCGAAIHGSPGIGLQATDSFVNAALREVDDAVARGAGRTGGLGIALTMYFAALSMSLLLILLQPRDVTYVLVFQFAVLLLGGVGVAVRFRESAPLFGLPHLTARGAALAVLGMAGAFALAFILLSSFPSVDEHELLRYRSQGKGLAYILLDYSIMPGVAEEILFRVVILGGLLRAFRERTAVLVSAFLFATLHLTPVSFAHHSIIGVVLARVRLGTGSIYPCMVLHATYNALVLAAHW
jgi:membrane protease YdiL (CAAX protease family)